MDTGIDAETRTDDTSRDTDQVDSSGVDRPAAARATVYTVLAVLLGEPNERLHERLVTGEADEIIRGLLGAAGPSVAPSELATDDDCGTICVRFNDPFMMGHVGCADRADGSLDSEGSRISLCESSYRPDATWNDMNLDLACAYDYFGLEIDREARGNHDYLPHKLEFASYLARLEVATDLGDRCVNDAARVRPDSHDHHLHVVAEGLTERMTDMPGTGPYDEVASFLGRFVATDQYALAVRFEGGNGP